MGESSTPGHIKEIGDPLEWMRRHSSMFFTTSISTKNLAERVAAAARLLGATDARVVEVEEWTIVGSSVDWFGRGRFPVPADLMFRSLTPFPEEGQNSTRPECLVAAFAREVLVCDERGIQVAQGTGAGAAAVETRLQTLGWRRALAFRGVDA